ncbi:MAG: AbrB family transcriptional regulator [Solirubrobacterales bacterium]
MRGATAPWWLALGVATAAAAVAADALGLPSAALFAALMVGIAYALTLADRHPLVPPEPVNRGAQAVVGVALGAAVDADTLRAVGSDWLPVLLVTVGTLAASLGAGLVMARVTRADAPTASLGLIAGGSSGIVAMADELGADGRMVAFMQYLRVLAVVLLAPPLAHLVTSGGGHGGLAASGGAGLAADLAFTAVCVVGGVLLARVTRVAGGPVLVPLIVAAALSISGLSGDAVVPDLVQQVGFALIGLQVGLRFTLASLREARDLLPATVVSIIGLIAVCAAMAAGMAPLAGVSYADAYLATTPGGLYAVLAAAADLGANTTFVVAVQALRVFVMVLAAPPLVRLLVSSPDPVRRRG